MTVYIALLRAVNLGGSTQLRMDRLADVVRGAEASDVRTLLQSGNVVFQGAPGSASRLESVLENALARQCGLRTPVFVRDRDDWGAIERGNPFPEQAARDPAHLVVTLLKSAPDPDRWHDLDRAIRGRERVHGAGRHAYIVYPDGIGRSKLTAAVIEGALGTPSTSRNWNTVRRLGALSST